MNYDSILIQTVSEERVRFFMHLIPVAYPYFWVGGRGLEIKKGNIFKGVRGAEPSDAGEILKFDTKFQVKI